MESRKTEAAEKKRSGQYNCAQAVLCTYRDKAGIDDATAQALGGAFAVGMGTMEGSCGALVGAGIVLGLASGDRNVARQRMRKVMTQFHQRNGATQCKLLKGVGTGKVLRECPDCVADAAEFLEQQL
ncbi:MAG: C_GCAxxG_C_C family protein [Bacteroidaceae bacterium]|nr:C_GCAxxG_C_C family protein [Bacteroidaceae bacterium]